MLRNLAFAASVLVSIVTTVPAAADPILVDQWYTFRFGDVGSDFTSGVDVELGVSPPSIAAPSAPWTFTLDRPGSISFVDGFGSGDQFSITDFGAAIGMTSASIYGIDCFQVISACFASAQHSRGTFTLSAGAHSIGGSTLASPFGFGAAFFRVNALTSAIPEPSTWAMMLLGFGFVGGAMRRSYASTETACYHAGRIKRVAPLLGTR